MDMLIPITAGAAAVGTATAAIPVVGTAAVAGDMVALVGMTATRGGIVGSVALATLMNRTGGDVLLDSDGQVAVSVVAADVGDVGLNGYQWYRSFGNVVGGGAVYDASPDVTRAAALPAGGLSKYVGIGTNSNTGALCGTTTNYSNLPTCYVAYLYSTDHCITGYVASESSYVTDPAAPKVPATNAQTQNAVKVHPDSWLSIYSDTNCGPTLALINGPIPDPCHCLYNDSCTGSGASFSTGGSSWSNNGCAVNSTLYPSTMVTAVPTTGTQTETNADGSKIIVNTTITKTTTVTGTNDRTNLVIGQTTTTAITATTITSTDGSTTVTMGMMTDRTPPQMGANTNQQQKNQTQLTMAVFVSLDIKLYSKKTKTFGGVLNMFRNTIRVSVIGVGVQRFFIVSILGSCSQWVVPQANWMSSIALGPIFCGPSALLVYQIAGYTVSAVTAFTALAIAFL